jgi:hypothetical protein
MPKRKPPDRHHHRLEGVTFAFVGRQFRAIRDAIEFVTSEGATVLDDVTPDVRYLVVPECRETPSTEQKRHRFGETAVIAIPRTRWWSFMV